MTGSDDSKILLWDLRQSKRYISLKTSNNCNQEHTAGVTVLQRDTQDNNLIISGSYDETINFFDLRKPKYSLYSNKINKTVWDFKQTTYKSNTLFFISCIYDGFKVFRLDKNRNFEEVLDFTEHKSIVYGVDIDNLKDSVNVVSCSFYDNLICYWTLI